VDVCRALRDAERLPEWERVDHEKMYQQYCIQYNGLPSLSRPMQEWAQRLFAAGCGGTLTRDQIRDTLQHTAYHDAIRWLRLFVYGLSGEGGTLPTKLDDPADTGSDPTKAAQAEDTTLSYDASPPSQATETGALSTLANSPQVAAISQLSARTTQAKQKRSTERGEARTKIISALTKHHQYANGSVLNREPIGVNELARQAEVAPATSSAFFKEEFKGHDQYRAMCTRNTPELVAALKLLNDEFPPHLLYGRTPSGQGPPDAE
jgi:hypothetical protein